MAAPAMAQDANMCGGVGANGQWLGGDEASSDISTSESYVEQMALVLLRNEYVGLFSVSEAGEYRIEAQGCDPNTAPPLTLGQPVSNSWNAQNTYSLTLDEPTPLSLTAENEDADPILTLYDPSGNWLAENDDYDGLNSRIDMLTPLPAGTYCVSLGLYGSESAPITVTATEYDAAEVLQSLYARGEASPPLDGSYPVKDLGELSTRAREDISVSGDATWYSLDVRDTSLILVEAIAQGQGDPVLTMFDDLGRQVAYNDDSGEGFDSLLTVRVQPGTYTVAVKQLSDSSGFIRMVFERYLPAQP